VEFPCFESTGRFLTISWVTARSGQAGNPETGPFFIEGAIRRHAGGSFVAPGDESRHWLSASLLPPIPPTQAFYGSKRCANEDGDLADR